MLNLSVRSIYHDTQLRYDDSTSFIAVPTLFFVVFYFLVRYNSSRYVGVSLCDPHAPAQKDPNLFDTAGKSADRAAAESAYCHQHHQHHQHHQSATIIISYAMARTPYTMTCPITNFTTNLYISILPYIHNGCGGGGGCGLRTRVEQEQQTTKTVTTCITCVAV